MNFLDKLERKFGKYSIKGIMMFIVTLNLAVFLLMYLFPERHLIEKLTLIPNLVMKGEVWRLITFLFIPPSSSPIWILFTLYFYYLIGTSLEHEWGAFRFNIYYFIGVVATIISVFISDQTATPYFLNMSLFLAFAFVYPNYQIMLFFVLPVKMKYLAWFDAAYLAYYLFFGGIGTKLLVAAAILNFVLFFGKALVMALTGRSTSYYKKRKYTASIPKKEYYHKCALCGITDREDKNMEFRYCMDCEGQHEYCMEHLHSHEHRK